MSGRCGRRAFPGLRMKGGAAAEWACVLTHGGVCVCGSVHACRCPVLCVCTRVRFQRLCGRGTPGWPGSSELQVRERAPSKGWPHSRLEGWVCAPKGAFLQVCADCACHCVYETEDGRQVPEARVCVWGGRGSYTPMWAPGLGYRTSVCPCLGASDPADGYRQAFSTPHGASAPFWAPCSVCLNVAGLCVRSQLDCAVWGPGTRAGDEDGLLKG